MLGPGGGGGGRGGRTGELIGKVRMGSSGFVLIMILDYQYVMYILFICSTFSSLILNRFYRLLPNRRFMSKKIVIEGILRQVKEITVWVSIFFTKRKSHKLLKAPIHFFRKNSSFLIDFFQIKDKIKKMLIELIQM